MKIIRFPLLGCFLLAISMLALSSGRAAVVLVDFNTTNGANDYPGGAAAWNIYEAPANVTGTLKDNTGDASAGLTISHTGSLEDSAGVWNAPGSAPAWATGGSVMGDYFWTGNNNAISASFTILFGGFQIGDKVSVDLIASRDTSSLVNTGYYEYSLDGGTTWAGFTVVNAAGAAVTAGGWDTKTTQTQLFANVADGYTNGYSMNITGVELAGASLQIRVTSPVGSSWAGLNAVRLDVIPEPGTCALLAGGLVALALSRRRSGIRR